MANRDLGILDPNKAEAIAYACDRLIAGEFTDQFISDLIQGGAGTSTNMNANEVIANLGLEYLGHKKENIFTCIPTTMSIYHRVRMMLILLLFELRYTLKLHRFL